MRVLLAGRFRGNRNAAQLPEEEGEVPSGNVGEEEKEEEEPASVVRLSQVQQKLQQAQTKAAKDNTKPKQPLATILSTGNDSCENISPKQPLSVISQKNLKLSPHRKRRLAKNPQEETDCKLRRLQDTVSSTTTEEASSLDTKPRAREGGIGYKGKARTATSKSKASKVLEATGENIARDSRSSPISRTTPQPTNRSNTTETNKSHSMVSSGVGRKYQLGNDNSREREEEEHLLNWQYNHHQRHAVLRRRPSNRDFTVAQEEAEMMAQPTIEGGFEGQLENDPASARGDISSASPERQSYDNDHRVGTTSSNLVIGRRKESPSERLISTRNRHDSQDWIASVPRSASIPSSRRDKQTIASAPGSERGMKSRGNNGNNLKKSASSDADEIRFREVLKKERGLEIREQDGDGNCLFRAISLQVYGDPSMHGDVRKQCMDHMVSFLLMRLYFDKGKYSSYAYIVCYFLIKSRRLCSSYFSRNNRNEIKNTFRSLLQENHFWNILLEPAKMASTETIQKYKQVASFSTVLLRSLHPKMDPAHSIFFKQNTRPGTCRYVCPITTEITTMLSLTHWCLRLALD